MMRIVAKGVKIWGVAPADAAIIIFITVVLRPILESFWSFILSLFNMESSENFTFKFDSPEEMITFRNEHHFRSSWLSLQWCTIIITITSMIIMIIILRIRVFIILLLRRRVWCWWQITRIGAQSVKAPGLASAATYIATLASSSSLSSFAWSWSSSSSYLSSLYTCKCTLSQPSLWIE